MREQKLSLCMIVKNERALIEDCLRSLKPIVDEMIIVDTGSTDETEEMARDFGAHVYKFSWTQDFSAARNFSISKATGDWILVLDADERISTKDLEKLKDLIKTREAKAFAFVSRNYVTEPRAKGFIACRGQYAEEKSFPGYFENSKVFLFRRLPEIKFEGVVHETVLNTVRDDLYESDIIVHHYGHVISEARNEDKRRLYIELGNKKIADHPTDSLAHYELGLEHQSHNNLERALQLFERAHELNPTNTEIGNALSAAYLRQNLVDQAEKLCLHVLRLNPTLEDSLSRMGTISMRRQQWSSAIEYYQRALEIRPQSFVALRNLGQCFCYLRKPQQARPYLEKAAQLAPSSEEVRRELNACLEMISSTQ